MEVVVDEPMDAASIGGRRDGRGPEEFRSTFIKTKLLSHAKGSAYVEFDHSKAMVGVFGPRQSERKFGFQEEGRLQCEVRLTSFAAKQLGAAAQQEKAEKELSAAISQALSASVRLDTFPKAVVEVMVMILEAGGSDLAVAITAASVALADAGIELYDLAPAVQLVRLDGQLLLDPSLEEARRSDGDVLLSMLVGAGEVTQMVMTGAWSGAETREAMELAMGGCGQLKALMRETLMEAAAG